MQTVIVRNYQLVLIIWSLHPNHARSSSSMLWVLHPVLLQRRMLMVNPMWRGHSLPDLWSDNQGTPPIDGNQHLCNNRLHLVHEFFVFSKMACWCWHEELPPKFAVWSTSITLICAIYAWNCNVCEFLGVFYVTIRWFGSYLVLIMWWSIS